MSIESALSQLDIKIYKHTNRNVLTRCFINPSHVDNDPSCMVNLDTGIIKCFGCKRSTNIIKIYQQRLGISTYREAKDLIFGSTYIPITVSPIEKKENKGDKKQGYTLSDLMLMDIKDLNKDYLKERGWSQEFLDDFNIRLCISDNYMDYAITPIISEKLNIYTFEARKILELDYLQKLFKSKSKSLIRLRAKFKNNKHKYTDSIYYEYLDKSKVLYPSNAPTNELIFNYDNLDFNEDLILVEGLASIPKIYYNLTKNITSCFGSKSSTTQISLLRKFKKRIIVIPDNDMASYLFIELLNKYLKHIYVFDIKSEDTDDSFIKDIKESTLLQAHEYILKYAPEILIENK